MIGKTLSHYTILEKLGEGGMGVVYKARDTKLDRFVALKFLPANVTSSAEATARFEQEAKAISALNHPNIAVIHDIDEAEGHKFLVLEFIPGGTLRSKLKSLKESSKELSIDKILDYGIQAADGLDHAHRNTIIHRDIKTDNVMLTAEGTVKLTDFGLAKSGGSAQLTQTGSTMGTAAYMSPEQMRGEDIDSRSDIFSLGVVLYELATQQIPFRGEHPAALAYSIVNEEPKPVTKLRNTIPPALAGVIARCLEKDRTKRYQTAGEIAADLRYIRQGSTVPVKPAAKRLPILWIAAAAVIAVLALCLYLFIPASHTTETKNKTIAVLPFTNMSGNKEDEYFSDGAFQIVEIYAYRGDKNHAFEWLDKAYNFHDGGLTIMIGDPLLNNIANDPRYAAFMKKMNLPL